VPLVITFWISGVIIESFRARIPSLCGQNP
jgi:hypothetical protein